MVQNARLWSPMRMREKSPYAIRVHPSEGGFRMSPSGSYDHADRVGVKTQCSICGALGVNRRSCPETTPEDHLAHRKPTASYRRKAKRVADPDEPRYEREWQSINNGEDLTLHLRPTDPKTHDITLRIRVKIKVVFE